MIRRSTDAVTGEAAATVAVELPDPALAAAALLLWALSGLAAAQVMARRGHDFRAVAGLGAALGPLFVPLAVDHLRRRDPVTRVVPLRGELPDGQRTVVLLTGEAERAADALPVLRRLGDPGTVALAVPVGFSTLRAPAHDEFRRAAERRAQQAATLLDEFDVVPVLAPGTPADVVERLVEHDDDLVLTVGDLAGPTSVDADAVGAPVVGITDAGGR